MLASSGRDAHWPLICSNSDVIAFDLGEKDLVCNDTQIRVIGSMEPEICVKVLRNLNENLGAKFPDTSFDFFKVKLTDDCIGLFHLGICLFHKYMAAL